MLSFLSRLPSVAVDFYSDPFSPAPSTTLGKIALAFQAFIFALRPSSHLLYK